MPAQANKQVLTAAFDALGAGEPRPFLALMADDFSWTCTGHGPWARTWSGKAAVRRELFGPLFEQFEGTYTNRLVRILAEDEWAVVECRGSVKTKAGPRYDNQYCYIIRFEGGLMRELTEYMDTALAERVLVAPERAA